MTPDPRERFLTLLREALAACTLKRLVLSRPVRPMLPPGFTDEGPVLQRLRIQPVRMRDGVKLAFAWQYDTRDQTDNLSVDEALVRIDALLGDMRTALLETRELTAELGFSKRGKPLFRMKRVTETPSLQDRRPAADDLPNPNPNPNPKEGGQVSAGGAASWQPGVGALTQLRRAGSGKTAARAGSDAFSRSHDTLADDDGWGELADHNRQRRYPVDIGRPYLVDLGIVGRTGALVPAMARKWRQINKFVEIVAQAWRHNTLANCVGRAGQPPLRIRDYGAGKGYLTFALYDHLTHALGLQVEMVGIERRADLVALCNRLAQRHGLSGLRFEKGDILQACEVAEVAPGEATGGAAVADLVDGRAVAGIAGVGVDAEKSRDSDATASDGAQVDIVIALHACDTATDDALFQGIRQRAAMLVCSPCCHRELRPQLKAPAPLDALLRHGIHLGQEAEMLTDGLRALLLETQGYEAQVFEFISPEHTGKNKMILGNRTGRARDADAVWAEIEALKRFYGIRTQRLDGLLGGGMGGARNPDGN